MKIEYKYQVWLSSEVSLRILNANISVAVAKKFELNMWEH